MPIENLCTGCGSAVNPGQPFCPRCGKDLAALWASISGSNPETLVSGSQQTTNTPPVQSAPLVQQGASARPWPFSVEILAERLAVAGYVQKPIIDSLLVEAGTTGIPFIDLVIDRKQLSAEAMRDALSRIFGLPIADLGTATIDWNLVKDFPSELARTHLLLPLHREGDRLVIVVSDPTQAEVIRTVRRIVKLTIDMRLAAQTDLAVVVHRYFSPRMVVLLPSGETLDLVIPPGETKIGRTEHNGIVLRDPTVGSTHAVLRATGDEYSIVDLGSRNGVYVNEQRVNQAQILKNGDVIGIGQCLLTFKMPLPDAAQSEEGATQILTPGQMPALRAAAMAQALRQSGSPGIPVTPIGVGAVAAVPGDDDDDEKREKKKKKKKDKEKEKEKEEQKLKSAWIGFASRIIAQVVGALATIILGLAVAGKLQFCNSAGNEKPEQKPPEGSKLIIPTAFAEKNGKEPFNASGVVSVKDSELLFCDNNINDALLRFHVGSNGEMSGSVERVPLKGLGANAIDDLEGMTVAEGYAGKKYILATTSLYAKKSKKSADPPSGLLRISEEPDGSLQTELIPNMRDFLIASSDLGPASLGEPDDNGLNVEGLAWDSANKRLLFGIRTPAVANKLTIIPVGVKDIGGNWTADNLSLEKAIILDCDDGGSADGIRSIEYVQDLKGYVIVVGNATSQSKAPFTVHYWDGRSTATQRYDKMWFDDKAKPEGFTPAKISGRDALVFVDDAGGFAVLWDDDERLH